MGKNKNKEGVVEYREIHAIVYVPDYGGQIIDEFCQQMEYDGYNVEAAKIMDYDDEDEETICARSNIRHSLGVEEDELVCGNEDWTRYRMYLIDWANTHSDNKYKGMSPVSYDEWLDNENKED